MKLNENLRIFRARLKSYFVSDQVRNFVLSLDDFFPSEKIFGLFGFIFINGLKKNVNQTRQQWQKKIFWTSVLNELILTTLAMINFVLIIGNSKKLHEASELFCWISGRSLFLAKIFFFFYLKLNALMKIIKKLDQHFIHSNREQLQFGAGKFYQQLKILKCFILTVYGYACSHFVLMPIVSLLFGAVLKLTMPIYFPLDPLNFWIYPIFFILQSSNLLFMTSLSIAFDMLFCSLTCVLSLEFETLAQKITQIDSESDENAEKKLREIVIVHNELNEVAHAIEEIFSQILLLYVFGAIFILCVCIFLVFEPVGLYLMIKFIPALSTAVTQVFCICFYAEQLQTSSMRVADEAYNSIWYDKNLKFRKMILIIMLRAQQPQKMTGWKFMDIGLPVFYWIIQTAHSYYSVLSGFYKS